MTMDQKIGMLFTLITELRDENAAQHDSICQRLNELSSWKSKVIGVSIGASALIGALVGSAPWQKLLSWL